MAGMGVGGGVVGKLRRVRMVLMGVTTVVWEEVVNAMKMVLGWVILGAMRRTLGRSRK